MMLSDLALPAVLALLAWISRRAEPDEPPPPGRAKMPGGADIPWPAAPPPTSPPPERITDVGPIDPTTDQPRETPPMQRGMPGTSSAIDRAIRRARAGGGGWRPAQRPTPAEVARAQQLLAPGVWREGTIETEGTTQYRGAWHPDRSGGGRHKGVEVWHRAPG